MRSLCLHSIGQTGLSLTCHQLVFRLLRLSLFHQCHCAHGQALSGGLTKGGGSGTLSFSSHSFLFPILSLLFSLQKKQAQDLVMASPLALHTYKCKAIVSPPHFLCPYPSYFSSGQPFWQIQSQETEGHAFAQCVYLYSYSLWSSYFFQLFTSQAVMQSYHCWTVSMLCWTPPFCLPILLLL